LKYIKFRENQNLKAFDMLNESKIVEVTGGFDRAIENYGEAKVRGDFDTQIKVRS
jgi:hypothetical protein